MKESELHKVGVCPACGMPAGAFEPYRERVSDYRKLILDLDIHPIAIHLSQTFVGLAPLLIILNMIFPNLFSEGEFPSLSGATTWLNSPPLTAATRVLPG